MQATMTVQIDRTLQVTHCFGQFFQATLRNTIVAMWQMHVAEAVFGGCRDSWFRTVDANDGSNAELVEFCERRFAARRTARNNILVNTYRVW